MSSDRTKPGISRQVRISEEGLQRLEKQLAKGIRINRPVLDQWIRRYGEPARELIIRYGQYDNELD